MTYEDAKAEFLLEYCPKCGEPLPEQCAVCEIDMAIKALEKQIPKKPLPTKGAADMLGANEPLWGEGECPNCKHYIRLPHKYCPTCGQAIDWSEEE